MDAQPSLQVLQETLHEAYKVFGCSDIPWDGLCSEHAGHDTKQRTFFFNGSLLPFISIIKGKPCWGYLHAVSSLHHTMWPKVWGYLTITPTVYVLFCTFHFWFSAPFAKMAWGAVGLPVQPKRCSGLWLCRGHSSSFTPNHILIIITIERTKSFSTIVWQQTWKEPLINVVDRCPHTFGYRVLSEGLGWLKGFSPCIGFIEKRMAHILCL